MLHMQYQTSCTLLPTTVIMLHVGCGNLSNRAVLNGFPNYKSL